jgi:pullulanase/glycogen debranching enzyme
MQLPSGTSAPDRVALADPLPRRPEQPLAMTGPDFALKRGSALPLGSTVQRDGVNFAVFSEHATAVTLVLFIPGQTEPLSEFPVDAPWHRTGSIWRVFVRGLDPGIAYGLRADDAPRHPAKKVLLDPYASLLTGGGWNWNGPRQSLVTTPEFDWGFDQPMNIWASRTVALQRSPDSGGNPIYIANAHWEEHDFELPPLGCRRFLDTSLPSPADICEPGDLSILWSQRVYPAAPRSVAVLIAPGGPAPGDRP